VIDDCKGPLLSVHAGSDGIEGTGHGASEVQKLQYAMEDGRTTFVLRKVTTTPQSKQPF
jgi:hypothetical protein